MPLLLYVIHSVYYTLYITSNEHFFTCKQFQVKSDAEGSKLHPSKVLDVKKTETNNKNDFIFAPKYM